MAYDPIEIGSDNWGPPVNNAFTNQDNRITSLEGSQVVQDGQIQSIQARLSASPVDYGLVAWNYEPWLAASQQIPAANQTLYMMRVEVPVAMTANGVFFTQNLGGSGFVAGNNYAGIYNSTGTLVATSNDVDPITQWTQQGYSQIPMTAPVLLNAETHYVAFLMDATTRPSILRTTNVTTSAPALNVFQPPETALWAQAAGTYTGALPASVTMASRTLGGVAWFAGIY